MRYRHGWLVLALVLAAAGCKEPEDPPNVDPATATEPGMTPGSTQEVIDQSPLGTDSAAAPAAGGAVSP